MTLSPDEAAQTLRDIAATETRSHRVHAYRQASPHLVLWGVLWGVGYGLSAVWPSRGTPIWVALVAIGLTAGFLIELSGSARRTPAEPAEVAQPQWRFPAIALTAFVFIAATLAVMAPVSSRQVGAFLPLVIAASYAVLGLWLGRRFIVIAAGLAALTLAGFFLLPGYFELWMAAGAGGALVLGGLWLRRV